MPHLDARNDFARARRAHVAARTAGWITGRRRARNPRTSGCGATGTGGGGRLEVVSLAAIVGAVEPSAGFDARFRPAAEHVRSRWERIALAHRQGVALPPVELLRCPDGYYVIDGRHRVSVARALGHRDIDAWVSRG